MKEIAGRIKSFIKEDFHPAAYIYVFFFLAVFVFLNYRFNLESRLIARNYGKLSCVFNYFALYSLAYFGVLIPFLLLKNKGSVLKNKTIYLKIFILVLVISVESGTRFLYHFIQSFDQFEKAYFLRKVINNLKTLVLIVLPVLALKLVFDRQEKGFYGLRKKGFHPLPFLAMLLIVLPLVTWASFQADFLHSYPSFKNWYVGSQFGLSRWQLTGIFELAYASDFVVTELVFRGILVIGMSALLGKEAVMAMCGLYVVVHFGKPAAETISSFFGGYILGVIAYSYRNILGGCVVHIGLAWMMEAAAFLQITQFGRTP